MAPEIMKQCVVSTAANAPYGTRLGVVDSADLSIADQLSAATDGTGDDQHALTMKDLFV
jgi:hypothetical protein